ncbi:hypothetical protein G6F40_015780 [Rhizopus arrhizus]|nr:hypothetical protein G6F40_015780 [Rhizopus arrhizus]
MDEAPDLLVTGLQAVEDKDFNRHHGIDLSGIARAVWVTIRSGGQSRQGASTLTQQLARSGLLGIGKEQTVTRKFNEVLLTSTRCTWASVAARPSTACPPAPSSGSAATCRRWKPSRSRC